MAGSECEMGNANTYLSNEERDGELLVEAAGHRWWDTISCLVKGGINVTYRTRVGASALHIALMDDNVPVDVVRMLIHPDLINSFCGKGETPLHVAANAHNTHVIKELLRANADPNIKTRKGETALDLYCRRLDLPPDVSILEAFFPEDVTIDMIKLLKKIYLSFLRCDIQEQDSIKSVLRFLLLHSRLQCKQDIVIKQLYSPAYCHFAVYTASNYLYQTFRHARQDRWFLKTDANLFETRLILMWLIKCGYTVKFPHSIKHNANPCIQEKQQEQVLSDVMEVYSRFNNQEENEPAHLFDLCSRVVHEHIQRPIRAEKYKELNLPSKIVRLLTKEDIVDQVYDDIVEYHENKNLQVNICA